MSFSRTLSPSVPVTGDLLTSYSTAIGMNFAATSFPEPNIEDTLFASIEGMEKDESPRLRALWPLACKLPRILSLIKFRVPTTRQESRSTRWHF
jgi:hypothetical protein